MLTLTTPRGPAARGPLSAAGAAACGALGTTGYGLEREGLEPLRNPRLSQALVLLKAAGLDKDDWRKASVEELRAGLGLGLEGRSLLANAIFVGTAQACHLGHYWAPEFASPGADRVDCQHLARPVSCLYRPSKLPTQAQLSARERPAGAAAASVQCWPQRSPLDVAAWILSSSLEDRHVAVVRFTGARDFRSESARFGHCAEDQIFLRTSYHQAFERMEGDLQAPVGQSLDEGGMICSSGVGLLRGAVRDGAPWYREPKKVDVLWVAVPPHPECGPERHGHRDWYASDADQAQMARTLDLIFAWAAARGTDALVLPPLGVDTHGCTHPALGVASLTQEAAQRYKKWLPQVHVASDFPAHDGGWWERFGATVRCSQGKPQPLPGVAPIQLPPCALVKKSTRELYEKHLRASGVLGRHGRAGDRQRGLTPRTVGLA